MFEQTTLMVAALFAVVFGFVALLLSCVSIAIVVGLKNSTHKIQYMPLDNPFAEDAPDKVPASEEVYPESPFTRHTSAPDLANYDEELMGGDWSNSIRKR